MSFNSDSHGPWWRPTDGQQAALMAVGRGCAALAAGGLLFAAAPAVTQAFAGAAAAFVGVGLLEIVAIWWLIRGAVSGIRASLLRQSANGLVWAAVFAIPMLAGGFGALLLVVGVTYHGP